METGLTILVWYLLLVACLTYFSTTKMKAVCSQEIWLHTYRITRRHIPEHATVHNHRCRNLKYNTGVRDWSLSWARLIQSTSYHPIPWLSFSILTSSLQLSALRNFYVFLPKVCIHSLLTDAFYMPCCPSIPCLFHDSNSIWRGVQIMCLLLLIFPTFLLVDPSYLHNPSQYPDFEHSKFMIFL
jgi:hypothetical protein